MSGPEAEVRVGNALPLQQHPAGHHRPQRGAVPGPGRPDGACGGRAAQILAKEGEYVQLRLPSGEVRLVRHDMHGDHRPGGQHRARQHQARQGGSQPLAGRSAQRRVARP